ncbi:hypothetical protein ACTXGL_01875 [Psychrobacter sp. T6-6]|uniref:hypothetical protein n=1 Tax=Psychrobacter sp. T6-6 TaxID=3457452 RepID=UPI003FD0A144
MAKLLTDSLTIRNLVGHSRYHCIEILSNQGLSSIDFGHWLAIPSQRLLLIFRNQQCVAIDAYQLAA